MNRKGFTLVEVILVIVIMALLLLVLVPNIFVMLNKNNEEAYNNLKDNIVSAAKMYVVNNKYNLGFTCGGTINITLQTLVDYGYLVLDGDKLINPIDDSEIDLSNMVEVTYNCDSDEFSYVFTEQDSFGVSDISLGDYVAYTPVVTSYTTDTSKTNHSSSQNIYPSELNLWRVLNINNDGTIELISEYVSSTSVYFNGMLGYQNLVGYLNDLAEQYETAGVTVRSRYYGYNGQTEYITDTSKFTIPAPWTTNTTATGASNVENQGGGDTLYTSDSNQLYTVLGTRIAYRVGTNTKTEYWVASRHYLYNSGGQFNWNGRYTTITGSTYYDALYYYNAVIQGMNLNNTSAAFALRPIITLKSNLEYTGKGTSDSPWKIVTR